MVISNDMIKAVNKTIHLDEEDLHPTSSSCAVCGCILRTKAGPLQESPIIEFLRCFECGVVSASRMPLEDILTDFYKQYYQNDFHGNRSEKVAVLSPKLLAAHIYKRLPKGLINQKNRILDFGGGDGSVALLLGKHLLKDGLSDHVQITVIDYDVNSVSQDATEAITIHKEATLSPDLTGTYDIILASAVLEHVVDLKETLEQLLSRLNPGGYFYARTPYAVPLRQFLSFFGMTFDFTYPAHLHDMGSFFWNRILNTLHLQDRYRLLRSQPSFVETPFSVSLFRATAANVLKAPWYILGDTWSLVGGWEVIIQRHES